VSTKFQVTLPDGLAREVKREAARADAVLYR
jgi:hypothetical protein